jgi:hypothetical protein
MASIFGKNDTMSKSWSDLWDEDEEEEEEEEVENQIKARQIANSRTWSHESKTDDDTITGGALELKSASLVNIAKSAQPASDIDGDIVADGFFFHETPQGIVSPTTPARYSPPSKRTTFDKWAALGERRRANTAESERSPDLWKRQKNIGLGFTGFGASGVWDSKVHNNTPVKMNNTPFKLATPVKEKGNGGGCPWVRDRERVRERPHRKGAGPLGDG